MQHYDNEWLKMLAGQKHVNFAAAECAEQLLDARQKLETANACDVCAGTGKPVSGKPCICGGTGQSGHEKAGLRKRVLDLELQVESWEKLVRTASDQIYAVWKKLRGSDATAADGEYLQVIATEMHRECRVIKGEEPLPHAGERLESERRDDDLHGRTLDAATAYSKAVPEKRVEDRAPDVEHCVKCGQAATPLFSDLCGPCYGLRVAGMEKRVCECVPGVSKWCPEHGYPPMRPVEGPGSANE